MTINIFELLSREQKFKILKMKGVEIAQRATSKKGVILYSLDGLYVELYYKQESIKLVHFYTFDTTENLTPYLEQIQL